VRLGLDLEGTGPRQAHLLSRLESTEAVTCNSFQTCPLQHLVFEHVKVPFYLFGQYHRFELCDVRSRHEESVHKKSTLEIYTEGFAMQTSHVSISQCDKRTNEQFKGRFYIFPLT
jgi:hypothetical protein